jgi:plastocyanin
MKRGLPIAPAAALLLLMPPSAAAAPRTHVVVIDNMKFGAMPAKVSPGDSILWINKDMFRHTATARDGSFNVDLPPGAKAKTVARKAAATVVTCKYHPGMRAVLRISK